MNKQKLYDAYENIRPSQAERDRMLERILLSSEISTAGKDETRMRKKMKPMVVAALIGLMTVLMGCAIVALSLREMKIADDYTPGYYNDAGEWIEDQDGPRDVISLHGFLDSPTFLAHQEWFEFYEEYSKNHEITQEENVFVPPEAYEAYSVYNQELIEKVDEIAEKYDLKLLGTFAPFQRSERRIFYEATGLDSLLIPGSTAAVERESGYFYQGGNFKVEFRMTMPGENGQWEHAMHNTMYYSKTDYFDTVYFVIRNTDDWNQWNYTTSDGAELLLAQANSGYGACIFCFREDASIYVGIDGYYQDDNGETVFMTDTQLEQVAEQFDYSLKVENVDIGLAKEALERFADMKTEIQTAPWQEYTDYESYVRDEIAKLGDRASEMYYCHIDLQDDGVEELIWGSREELESVWTMTDGRVNLILEYGDKYKKLKAEWPTMDKKPITEYAEK